MPLILKYYFSDVYFVSQKIWVGNSNVFLYQNIRNKNSFSCCWSRSCAGFRMAGKLCLLSYIQSDPSIHWVASLNLVQIQNCPDTENTYKMTGLYIVGYLV